MIASIVDVEVDWTNIDGSDTNSVMIERVKEWITEDMDRYFSESIDDAVDGKVRKLKIEKLRNIIKEIKSSKDKSSDKIGSDQTIRYYPSHQTSQSHATHDLEQIHMQSSIASSDMSSVATPMLFTTPPFLATTAIQTYTSSETQFFTGDTLQFTKKAETDEKEKNEISEQQKLVCELCVAVDDNIFSETEKKYENSTRGLPWNLKQNFCKVKPAGTECMAKNNNKFCAFSGCLKTAKKGGKCVSHGGGIRCSVAECSKSAQKGGKCFSHGGGTRCSTAECSKYAQKGGKCFSHGGGTRCSVAECLKIPQKGGKCVFHGGGIRCSVAGCAKSALKGGKCISHGGGIRCSIAECSKSAKKG